MGSILTLTLGAGVVAAQDSPNAFTLLGWILCVSAGLAVVGRRHRQHIVPIGAIFTVFMFIALAYVWFWIQWNGGLVEL
jgi:hypothetical protein